MEGSPSPKSARGKRRKRSRGSKRSRHQRSKSTDSTVSQLTSESSDAIILNHLQRKSSAGELVNDAELLAEVVQHGEAMEEQGVKSQSVGEDSVRLAYDVSAWRDRGFAVAFVLHLGFLVFLAAQFGEEAVRDGAFAVDQEDSEGDSPFHYNTRSLAAMVVMSCAVASAFGFVWVGVMRHSPGVVLKTGVWLFLVLSVVIVTLLFVFDAAVVALFYLLVVLFISLYLYVVRRRIPFAEAALNVSLQALHTNAGPFKAVAAMLVLQVMWLVFWAFTMVSVVHQGAGSLSIFGVLSFYWTQQVLFNVAHATTAGSVASFWYVPESPDPTWHSFRRATSTSFGSICQGSLLVSVLKSIRFVVRLGHSSHDRHGGMFTGVSLAILQCVDTLVRYFNEYAFAYVAVYGYSYGRSAQLTFDLIHDRGFDMLINDDLTSFAIFFGSFASGTLSACVAIVWTKAFELDSFVLFFVLSFVIGYTTCSLLLSPVSSAISTTFLIWADDSAVMNDTHHEYFDVLRLAANKMHNSDMMWDARTGGFTDAHGNALEGV